MNIIKKILENPFVIIIYSSFLILFHVSPAFYLLEQKLFSYESVWFQLVVSINAVIVLFIIPFYIIKFIYKKKIVDFGFRMPENLSYTIKLTVLILVFFTPIMFFLSKQTSFQDYYSVDQNIINFILLSIISGIYYFAEEFLFRGLLFFGIWDKFKFHSFWIVNTLFALFHIGKPPYEIILAFFLGLTLTYLSYKTKSFIPAVVVHFTLALILNIIVTFFYTSKIVGSFHY